MKRRNIFRRGFFFLIVFVAIDQRLLAFDKLRSNVNPPKIYLLNIAKEELDPSPLICIQNIYLFFTVARLFFKKLGHLPNLVTRRRHLL